MSSSTQVPEIPPKGEPPTTRHEDRDVNLRAIAYFFLALLGLALFGHVGLYGLFRALIAEDASHDPPLSPLVEDVPELPPEPRLQPIPEHDLRQFRAGEDAILTTYGRSPDGSVHIPIDRAIELTAQKGLPVRLAPASSAPSEADEPTESTLGRPTE